MTFIEKCDEAFPPKNGTVVLDCVLFREALLKLAEELVREERATCAVRASKAILEKE